MTRAYRGDITGDATSESLNVLPRGQLGRLRGPRTCRGHHTSDFYTSPQRSRYAASFKRSLAIPTLRFTLVVATNSPEGAHLLVDDNGDCVRLAPCCRA